MADTTENERNVAIKNLKDDFKLLSIAFQRLWRDVLSLVKSLLPEDMNTVPGLNIPQLNKKWLWGVAVVAFAVLLFVLLLRNCGSGEEAREYDSEEVLSFEYEPRVERPLSPHKISFINYRKAFNDMNDTHLAVAKKIGISPLKSREAVNDATRKLVETNDNEAYTVDNLTHSIPYLVPEAADLLSVIGRNFQDSLVMKHLPPHKLIVTSVLRTQSDVKRLRRGNVNSSANSAHCFGTTFDITWKRFLSVHGETTDNSAKLKQVLAEVLRDLKKAGCCYVKHEVKQACFHITARDFPK